MYVEVRNQPVETTTGGGHSNTCEGVCSELFYAVTVAFEPWQLRPSNGITAATSSLTTSGRTASRHHTHMLVNCQRRLMASILLVELAMKETIETFVSQELQLSQDRKVDRAKYFGWGHKSGDSLPRHARRPFMLQRRGGGVGRRRRVWRGRLFLVGSRSADRLVAGRFCAPFRLRFCGASTSL